MILRGWIPAGGVALSAALLYAACSADNSATAPDAGAAITDAKASEGGNSAEAGTDAQIANLPATVLTDPAIWSAVPNSSGCALFQANVSSDPFPQRTWSSCGTGAWATGCSVADAGVAIDTFSGVVAQQTSGALFGNEIYVQANLFFASTVVAQVFRLSDGVTVAATRIDQPEGPCFWAGFPHDTPFLFTPMYEFPDSGTIDFFGVAPTAAGTPTTWDQHWLSNRGYVGETFSLSLGHGYEYNDGEIAITSAAATDFTTIASSPEPEPAVSARNDLLVWGIETPTGGSLMAYTAAHGVQTLTTIAKTTERKYPLRVAMSDDHIVWATVTENASETFDSIQLSWSPIATQPSEVVVTTGPTLPKTFFVDDSLAIGGDYATFETCDSTGDTATCSLDVVQLSTQKLWVIPHRPGANNFLRVLGVSSNELVLAESNGVNDTQLIRRIVRIKTSQLDALAVPP